MQPNLLRVHIRVDTKVAEHCIGRVQSPDGIGRLGSCQLCAHALQLCLVDQEGMFGQPLEGGQDIQRVVTVAVADQGEA